VDTVFRGNAFRSNRWDKEKTDDISCTLGLCEVYGMFGVVLRHTDGGKDVQADCSLADSVSAPSYGIACISV